MFIVASCTKYSDKQLQHFQESNIEREKFIKIKNFCLNHGNTEGTEQLAQCIQQNKSFEIDE